MIDWKPISEAPKDGTKVLLYDPKHDWHKIEIGQWLKPWDAAPSGWFVHHTGYMPMHPTHYADLTPPRE